jgi:hypothetical protein
MSVISTLPAGSYTRMAIAVSWPGISWMELVRCWS